MMNIFGDIIGNDLDVKDLYDCLSICGENKSSILLAILI